MRPAWLVLASAACSSARGADIELKVPVAADEVDVFVAPQHCATCDNEVAWDNSGGKLHGDVFMLDIDETTTATRTGDNAYRLVLVGRSDNEHVARILFVAFSGGVAVAAARIEDVVVPADHAETWNIALKNVTDVPANDPPPTNDGWRVRGWVAPEATVGRCLVSEVAINQQVSRELFLRPGDTDCDGVPAPECDKFYYKDPGSSTIDAASCVKYFPWPTAGTPTCLLGGSGCSELGNASTCLQVAPEYCAPEPVCSTCIDTIPACVHNGQVGAIRCTAFAMALDTPCPMPYTASVDLSELVKLSPNVACGALGFSDASRLPMVSFSPTWSPPSTTGAAPSLSAMTGAGNCMYDLAAMVPTGSTIGSAYYAIVDVPLSNGRHDVLPIEVTVQFGQCPVGEAPISCSLDGISGSDTIHACAAAP